MSDILTFLTAKMMRFFIPELLAWIFIQKYHNKFKFRFGSPKEGSLKFTMETWLVAFFILLSILFSENIFEIIIGQSIDAWLTHFGAKVIFILLLTSGFTFLWVYHYLMEKRWDKVSTIVTIIAGFSVLALFML